MQTISISQYISKLANLSNFDTKIERLALEIAKKTENHLIIRWKITKRYCSSLSISSIDTTWNKYLTDGYL